MKNVTDILGEMAEENLDLKLSQNFHGARTIGGGNGVIEIGVDAETIRQLYRAPGKFLFLLYIVNADQYFAKSEERECIDE